MSESARSESIKKKFERFISKLKQVKSQSKEQDVMINVGKPINVLENTQEESSDNEIEIQNNLEKSLEISSESFKSFCEELKKFTNLITNNSHLTHYLYKYPQHLQKQINIDVEELQNLLAEINETMTNIKKLRDQQKFIKKESSTLKKTLRTIKNAETKELESVVSTYDKKLYNRWSKAKWNTEAMEDLLFDIQEKQIVLESLQKLINMSIDKAKESGSIDEESENSANEDKAISTLPSSTFSFEKKIPSPPPPPPTFIPRPVPLTVNTYNRNNSRLSWAQRRFRAERRGRFVPVHPIAENQENEPYVFSFNRDNTDFGCNTLEFTATRFSSNSTETISSASSNNQNDVMSSGRQADDEFDIKSEIQSMLFGERSRNQIILLPDNSGNCASYSIPEESNEINEVGNSA